MLRMVVQQNLNLEGLISLVAFAVLVAGKLEGQEEQLFEKPVWELSGDPIRSQNDANRISAVDLNGDSLMDLVAYSFGRADTWHNRGHGEFSQGVSFKPTQPVFEVAGGDWDGDGDLDFVAIEDSPRPVDRGISKRNPTAIIVWLNNGKGAFSESARFWLGEPEIGLDIAQIEVSDLNGDGRSDMVIFASSIIEDRSDPQRWSSTVSVYGGVFLSNGDGSFLNTFQFPKNVTNEWSRFWLGDLNGDELADIVMPREHQSYWQVWLNSGGVDFESTETKTTLPEGLVLTPFFGEVRHFFDVNGDDHQDILVPVKNSANFVFLGDGNGGLSSMNPEWTGQFSSVLAVEDVNGDGRSDFIGNGLAGKGSFAFDSGVQLPVEVRIRQATGDYTFVQRIGGHSPKDLLVNDINADGRPDFVVLTRRGIEVWLQEGAVPLKPEERDLAVIEDPIIRSRIAQTLGKSENSISVSDLSRISTLNLSKLELNSLVLPMGLRNLQELNLSLNNLSVIELPSDAIRVSSISLSGNQSLRVEIKGGATSLERLVFTGAALNQLEFDRPMEALTALGLWATEVRNFDFLSKLPALKQLNLGDMGLTEVVIPQQTADLDELWLSENPLLDVLLPEGFAVQEIFGFSPSKIRRYVPEVVEPRHSEFLSIEPGPLGNLVIRLKAGIGAYRIMYSTDLSEWEPIENVRYTFPSSQTYQVKPPRASSIGFLRVENVGRGKPSAGEE